MIITILPNSSDFHAVAYNERKVSQGLAELIKVQNFTTLTSANYSVENFRQYLDDYSKRNDRIKNSQFHFSVSCKGTEYTHSQLLDIAHMYLKEMGYAEEGQPLLVYAHHDTPNNHIHVITSRVAPDGRKISKEFEKKRSRLVTMKIMERYTGQRQEPSVNEVAALALAYSYTSKAQYCSILNSMGYDTKEDDEKSVIHIYKGGEELCTIKAQLIMQHALRENKPDDKRRRQLRAVLKKYRDFSANKEELAASMKKKFGISLVYLGRKDTPFGYVVVDHKNKTVYKGGEFLSIKELLQFENAATRFAKVEQTIDELLKDNPNLTTADVNKILYRQFGTRIHKGTISWNGETVQLKNAVVERLKQNYLASKGITPNLYQTPTNKNPLPSQRDNRGRNNIHNPLANAGGSSNANREYEINGGMDVSGVDDEQSQRAKWRR